MEGATSSQLMAYSPFSPFRCLGHLYGLAPLFSGRLFSTDDDPQLCMAKP